MTGHTRNSAELIDNFLSGTMSPEESAQFEMLLEADPLLKEDFLFQQSIIGGIKEYRKDQLKARLNSITIGVGITGLLVNSAVAKLVTAVTTIGVIGVGTYYVTENLNSERQESAPQIQEIGLANYPELPENVLEETIVDVNEVTREDDNTEENSLPIESQEVAEEITTATLIEPEEVEEPSLNTPEQTTVLIPQFEVPAFDESGKDEEVLEGIALTVPTFNQSVNPKEASGKSEIEIENITKTKYDLHYKFSEGKLFLYGDFGDIPYELLEINSKASRTLYLYHDNAYYFINQLERNIKQLKALTNKELIKELDILRNNKI